MNTGKIELRKKRSFSDKINVTFEFLRLNFKPLFKVILFIAIPFVLVCAITMSLTSSFFGNVGSSEVGGLSESYAQLLSIYSSPSFLIVVLLLSIGFVFTLSVTYEFMNVYMEGGDLNDVSNLWQRSIKHVLGLVVSSIGNTFIMSLVFLVLIGIIASFSVFGSSGVIAAFFFGFFAVIGLFILMSPLFLVYPIQVIENVSYGKALSRVAQLVKGREWFSTAGLAFIMFILYYFIQLLFSIPFQIINFATVLHDVEQGAVPEFGIFTVLTYVVSVLGSFFTIPIFWVAMAFQYFNLVEKRELVGLISQIDKIGDRTEEEDTY